MTDLLTIKELCVKIGRGRTWMQGIKREMERNGIIWPAGMMTPELVLQYAAQSGYRCTAYKRGATKARNNQHQHHTPAASIR